MTATVEQLYAELGKLVKKGMGGKKILLSNDDEGNGYHEMFYGITDKKKNLQEIFGGAYPARLPHCVSKEEVVSDYVIIG